MLLKPHLIFYLIGPNFYMVNENFLSGKARAAAGCSLAGKLAPPEGSAAPRAGEISRLARPGLPPAAPWPASWCRRRAALHPGPGPDLPPGKAQTVTGCSLAGILMLPEICAVPRAGEISRLARPGLPPAAP